MKMYGNSYHGIEEVEVERKSDHFVWINGRRHALRTMFECYFGTYEECKAFLVAKAEKKLEAAKRQFDMVRSESGCSFKRYETQSWAAKRQFDLARSELEEMKSM